MRIFESPHKQMKRSGFRRSKFKQNNDAQGGCIRMMWKPGEILMIFNADTGDLIIVWWCVRLRLAALSLNNRYGTLRKKEAFHSPKQGD